MNNLDKLKSKLLDIGHDPRAFSLNEGSKPDAYCLENSYGTWTFYYMSERGTRHDEKVFTDEEKALDYIYSEIINDCGTKLRTHSLK